jgi:hypothetical protein
MRIGHRLLAGLLLLASNAGAEVLIKESEAALPPLATAAGATRAITRGPTIRVIAPAPDSGPVKSPFALKIAFEPHGGAKVDPSTVQVIYLRNPTVDLTERVKAGLSGKGIELGAAEAPPGAHQIRISVEDNEGRRANSVVNLNVVK